MASLPPYARPTLGYPSRIAAIEGLAARGMDAGAIAELLRMTKKDVQTRLCKARQRLCDRRVDLPPKLAQALAAAAEARGTDMPSLAIELLELVAREDLFEALLGEHGDA